MAKQVFLSYGREQEVQAFVIRLKHDLESNGFTVWLDIEDIPAGCDWHAAIGRGLHNCKGLIAVITKKYLNSRYCTSELYTADSDQKSIFPVIFEDVNFEQSEKSMGVKYVISGINWSFFRPEVDNYAGSLGKLMQGMADLGLGTKPVEDVDSVSNKVSQLQISPGQYGAPPSAQPAAAQGTPPYTPSSGHSNQSTPGSGVSYPHQPHAFVQPSPPHPYYPHQLPPPPMAPPGSQYPAAAPPTSNTQYPPSTSPIPFYPPGTPPQHPMPHPPYYPPAAHFPGPYHNPAYPPGYSPQYMMAGSYALPTHPPQGYGMPYATDGSNPAPPHYGELFPDDHSNEEDSLPDEKPPLPVASAPPPPSAPGKKPFKIGMKVEALDRRFPYFICVATIMDRKDNGEVRVHFDGWGEEYDYWCDADDIELHPVGWCSKHNYELQTTRGITWKGWNKYLTNTQSEGADNSYFNEVQLAAPGSLHFRPEMRLEAKNRLQSGVVGVATIDRIADGKLLIHFDGWNSKFDFWCSPNSTDIHPAMWTGKHSMKVEPPRGRFGHFLWNQYLSDPDINPAPAHVFTQAQLGYIEEESGSFTIGMKLEAKDRKNPGLICVATITDVKGDELRIHFDGWSDYYDYWCDEETTDIHPVGWCRDHSRALQKPKDLPGSFSWNSYLSSTGSKAAPRNAFTEAQRK